MTASNEYLRALLLGHVSALGVQNDLLHGPALLPGHALALGNLDELGYLDWDLGALPVSDLSAAGWGKLGIGLALLTEESLGFRAQASSSRWGARRRTRGRSHWRVRRISRHKRAGSGSSSNNLRRGLANLFEMVKIISKWCCV